MTPAPWFSPLTQALNDRRRIWRESQRRRRAGLKPLHKPTASEAARHAASARWAKP